MKAQDLSVKIIHAQALLAELTQSISDLTEEEQSTLANPLRRLANQLEPESERPEAQVDLPFSAETYQLTLDHVGTGVIIYDRNRRIRYANPRIFQFFGGDPTGLTRNEFLERFTVSDSTGRALSTATDPILTQVWAGIQTENVQLNITNRHGEKIQIIATAFPLPDGSGTAVVWNDVTRLEQALLEKQVSENHLLESEARFRAALATGSIFVYTIDRDLRYTWLYSPESSYNSDRAIGKRNEELIQSTEDVRRLEAIKRQVIETGIGFREDVTVTIHGEPHFFDMTFEPMRDAAGNITGLAGAAQDITNRRRLESREIELAARAELHRHLIELREREMHQLAERIQAGVLQDAIGLVATAQLANETGCPQAPDQPPCEMAAEINSRARSLSDGLRQLCLELTPPAPTQFGLMRAINAYTQDLQNRYPDIHFQLDLMEDILKLPDPFCLSFYNIYRQGVVNAIQHAWPANGTGAPKQIQIRLRFSPQTIGLEIEDNGQGLNLPVINWMEMIRLGHFGLVHLKEQAESINAHLTFETPPGGGTLIRVLAPQPVQV